MKKILLAIGLMTVSLSAMALSNFNFGFETPSNELTVGKLDYVNFKAQDVRDTAYATDPHSGTLALKLTNAVYNADSTATYAGNNWERALKFRNLNLQENTSYRVSFWAKGSPTYSVDKGVTNPATNIRATLAVGTEYHDIDVVGKGNVSLGNTFTGTLNNSTWKKHSTMIFYTSDAAQQAAYMAAHPDSVAGLPLNHFLNLTIYNPGTFYLDDVSVEASTVKSVTFADNIIKVDLGYAYNAVALRAGKDFDAAILPVNSVSVTVNGDVVVPEAVELQPKGFFVFLPFDYALTDQDVVVVSFTNPVGTSLALQYTDDKRPFNMDANASKDVLNFSNENADFDPAISELAVFASLYNPPFVKKSVPENNSFDMTKLDTFSITYNTEVEAVTTGNGPAPVAKLSGPGMPVGGLVMSPKETGVTKTLTFVIPSMTPTANGEYVLKISNIRTVVGTPSDAENVLYYSLGVGAGGAIIKYLDSDSAWKAAGENSVPAGWRKFYNNVITGDSVNKTGQADTRLFLFPNCTSFKSGYYICSRGCAGDSTYLAYGMNQTYGAGKNFKLHLTPGKYQVSFSSAFWTNNALAQNKKFQFFVEDNLTGAIILQDLAVSSSGNFAESKPAAVSAAAHSYTFIISTESDYRIKFLSKATGFDGVIIGGVKMSNIPSTAAIYKNNLEAAYSAAKAVLTAQADTFIYAGTAKTALAAAVTKYTGWSNTAPSAYDAAVVELDNARLNMATHRTNVDNYLTSLTSSKAKLADSVTIVKSGLWPSYIKLQQIVPLYDTTVVSYNVDAQLVMGKDSLTKYLNSLNGAIASVVPLTYGLTKSLAAAAALPIPVPTSHPAVKAAKTAITDDVVAKANLNTLVKQYLEGNIAANTFYFKKDTLGMNLDSISDVQLVKDSLELTGYFNNPNFYTAQRANSGLTNSTFPGWKAKSKSAAGLENLATEVNPVIDAYIRTLADDIWLEQTVTGVPVGIYDIFMKNRVTATDGTGKKYLDYTQAAQVFLVNGAVGDTLWLPFGTSGNLAMDARTVYTNVLVSDGTFTLGAKCVNTPGGFSSTTFIGDPMLYMVAKAPSYTYTGVKNVVTGTTVKEVQYYTIQGVRVNRMTKGLNIEKTVYDNGSVSVRKVMLK